jgi:hypothetical protein
VAATAAGLIGRTRAAELLGKSPTSFRAYHERHLQSYPGQREGELLFRESDVRALRADLDAGRQAPSLQASRQEASSEISGEVTAQIFELLEQGTPAVRICILARQTVRIVQTLTRDFHSLTGGGVLTPGEVARIESAAGRVVWRKAGRSLAGDLEALATTASNPPCSCGREGHRARSCHRCVQEQCAHAAAEAVKQAAAQLSEARPKSSHPAASLLVDGVVSHAEAVVLARMRGEPLPPRADPRSTDHDKLIPVEALAQGGFLSGEEAEALTLVRDGLMWRRALALHKNGNSSVTTSSLAPSESSSQSVNAAE